MTTDADAIRTRHRVLLIAAAFLLASGTLVFHWIEGWSYVDSLYFCTVTLATVGFGDIVPTTDLGKLATVVYIIAGVGIIASFFSVQVRYRAIKAKDRREARKEEEA